MLLQGEVYGKKKGRDAQQAEGKSVGGFVTAETFLSSLKE